MNYLVGTLGQLLLLLGVLARAGARVYGNQQPPAPYRAQARDTDADEPYVFRFIRQAIRRHEWQRFVMGVWCLDAVRRVCLAGDGECVSLIRSPRAA